MKEKTARSKNLILNVNISSRVVLKPHVRNSELPGKSKCVGTAAAALVRSPMKRIWETMNANNFGLVMTSLPFIRPTVRTQSHNAPVFV